MGNGEINMDAISMMVGVLIGVVVTVVPGLIFMLWMISKAYWKGVDDLRKGDLRALRCNEECGLFRRSECESKGLVCDKPEKYRRD